MLKEEKRTSLLKPYTNFDNIKDLNIDKMAEMLAIVEVNAVCCYIPMGKEEYLKLKRCTFCLYKGICQKV